MSQVTEERGRPNKSSSVSNGLGIPREWGFLAKSSVCHSDLSFELVQAYREKRACMAIKK